MSKKKEILVNQLIIEKAKDLGFIYQNNNELCVYKLPFGNSNELWLDCSEEIPDISIGNVDNFEY